MRKLLSLSIIALALAAAATASAATSPVAVGGVVVASHGGSLLVASPQGLVRAVSGHARIGARVSLAGGKLTVVGRAHRALITGVVIRRRGNLTFLSASHHVLVVHSGRSGRTLASARDTSPSPGTVVQATVGFDDQGELDEENEDAVGQAQSAQVQATVTAVAAGSVTLSVNGQSLTIPLPAGLTLPATIVGTQVTLTLDFGQGAASVAPGQDEDNQGDDNDDDNGAPPSMQTPTTPSTTTPTMPMPSFGHHGDGGHGGGGEGGDS
jgi:hypothetical protein